MAGNPWQVESILAFYCLKCPECEFYSKEENDFIHHANEYHPLSCILFDQETSNSTPYNYNEEIDNAHIKQEQVSDIDDYYSYPDVFMNQYENENNEGIEIKTEFTDENDPLMANQYENENIEGVEIKTEFTDENIPLKLKMKPTKKEGKLAKPSKCTLCDKTFSNKPQLKRHYASVHEGQKPYTCVLCQDGFNTVKNLKEHMEMVHDGTKPHNHISRLHDEKLDNISKLVGMKQKLKNGHSLKTHSCPHCEKYFTRTDNLATHIKTVHEGRRYEECPICHITFAQPYMRKKHIESVHEGKKPLLCPREGCDKAFSRQSSLNKHINYVHEGKKPYPCDFCDLAFRDKFHLARHNASGKCIVIRQASNEGAMPLPEPK